MLIFNKFASFVSSSVPAGAKGIVLYSVCMYLNCNRYSRCVADMLIIIPVNNHYS